jgi:circadian clock protein KaiC
MTFVMAAVARGEQAALFLFDEELGLLFERADELRWDIAAGRLGGRCRGLR